MALSNLVVGQPFCVDGTTPVVPLSWNMGGALSVTVKIRAKEVGIDQTISTNVTGDSINIPYTVGHHYIFVVQNNANQSDILIYGNASNPAADPADWTNATDVCAVPPFQPNTLTATPNGAGSIVLNWVDGSDNEATFEIQRASSANGVFATITSVLANVQTYTDTGLIASTPYWYRVRAVNANGQSAYTNTATATTQAATASTGGSSFVPFPAAPQPSSPSRNALNVDGSSMVILMVLAVVWFLFVEPD